MTPDFDDAVVAKVMADTQAAVQRAATMGVDERARSWLVDVPLYDAEGVVIERLAVDAQEAALSKLRAAFNPQRGDRSVDTGVYTTLTVDGVVWMSDTPAETRDHLEVDVAMAERREGSMLVVGLGLGVILNRAITVHRMRHITIVERDPRIVRAVMPHYLKRAAECGCVLDVHVTDVHEWKPPRRSWWDVAWFDIWATINDEDMPEVKRLRDRFRTRCGWSGAWAQGERIAMRHRIERGWAY